MKYREYATTYGEQYQGPRYHGESGSPPDDPEPPPGEGWVLIAMACSDEYLYWSWGRE